LRNIGLGLIGLGYVGRIHLRNAMKLSTARLVAVSDISRKALGEAEKAGVKKTFTRYEQLLEDPEIDAVVIALPTHLHMKCAVDVAESGKHIFLEKPIARNTVEAKEIIAAAKKNAVELMIGYPLRFHSEFSKLKEKIKSGVLGEIEVAYASYISSGPFLHRAEGHIPRPVPDWWFHKELTGGGALMDVGSHIINLLRWFFGEILNVKSRLGHRFNLDMEDQAVCLANFESKTLGVINVGWFSQKYQLKVELLGSVGHAEARHEPPNTIFARALSAAQMLATGNSEFHRPHLAELQYFVRCLVNELPPHPSGEDGLKDLEAISQAYQNELSL
jgi:predicted dehydrogenase